MNASRTIAITALAAGLATTARSGGSGQTPTTVVTVAPAPTPTTTDSGNVSSLSSVDAFGVDATSDGDPAGSPVEFAVRYLNDLRVGEWDAALDQMSYIERTNIFLDDNAAAVGHDVLFNASGGTSRLAPCTSGQQFATDAVIVRCGTANVVVHVQTTAGFRGVRVSEVFIADDHAGQPHTHAYTRLL